MQTNSRGASIKTRIETYGEIEMGLIQIDSRGASIKTRIETKKGYYIYSNPEPIQEAHPLKQGLKPSDISSGTISRINSRGASIKTRIETGSS